MACPWSLRLLAKCPPWSPMAAPECSCPLKTLTHWRLGIVDLLQDSAERQRLGAAAKQLIEEEYSAERMAADYLRVYKEAIAAAKIGSGTLVESSAAHQGNAK